MSRNRRPVSFRDVELNRLRTIWQKATLGDLQSKDHLLSILVKHKSVDAFVRYWVELKTKPIPPKNDDTDVSLLPETPDPKVSTPWQRTMEHSTKTHVQIVSGGLPSLGKRSK